MAHCQQTSTAYGIAASASRDEAAELGLTAEQLREVTVAAASGAAASSSFSNILDYISARLHLSRKATEALLRTLEEQDIPESKLAEGLFKVAKEYKQLQVQLDTLNSDNQTARMSVISARAEIDVGNFGRARELLRQATNEQIAAAQETGKLQGRAQAAADAQMLGAANSTAAEGKMALVESDYREAAELFGQAAGYVPPAYTDVRLNFEDRKLLPCFVKVANVVIMVLCASRLRRIDEHFRRVPRAVAVALGGEPDQSWHGAFDLGERRAEQRDWRRR